MSEKPAIPEASAPTSHLYPWLRTLLEPLKPVFKEALAISLFTNLLALAVPLFTLQVYDRVVAHNGESTLVALSIGILLALGFDFVLRQSRSRLLQNVALHLDAQLGRMLYDKFSSLPLRTLEEKPSSYWQGLFQDMTTLRSIFSGPTAVMVLDIPFALVFVIVIFVLAFPVAWLLLIIIPTFLILTYFSSRLQSALTTREVTRQQNREGLLAELIAGRTTVKALMIDKAMRGEFESVHARTIQQSYHRGALADNFIAFGQTLAQLSTVFIVIAGALAIIDRDLTVGSLIATTMLTGRIIAPLNQLVSGWRQFAAAKQAAIRLETLFQQPSQRENPGIKRGRPNGDLSVEHVSFSYKKDAAPVVNEIAFKIGPGLLVGMIGRNGCGKTTLVKLLLGLYTPDKGRILLDGADMQQFSRNELASWIGYVPQECFLFAGTIKDNIKKAHPEATDEEILEAAKRAGADPFIINLPDGYNTQIGEAGHMLSGGQRQRIAIARALLRNPPILLLDEVSNHLDSDAERALTEMLHSLKADHTIITVTHSPTLLRSCDRIMVIEKGRLAMAGPSEDVFARISGPMQPPPPTAPATPGKRKGGGA